MISLEKMQEIARKKAAKYGRDYREDVRQEIIVRMLETKPVDVKSAWSVAHHAAHIYLRREYKQGMVSLDSKVEKQKGDSISLVDMLPDMRFDSMAKAREALLDIPKSIRAIGVKKLKGIVLTPTERKRLQYFRQRLAVSIE